LREHAPGGRPEVCTAVAIHDLAFARLLASDLERVHPGWRLTVLLLDGDPDALGDEPFDSVGREALALPEPGLLEISTRGPSGLAAALRPLLMTTLVERSGAAVVWLDATVRVLGSLDPVVDAARAGIALVPLHPRFEVPEGLSARGPFESGVVAASDADALAWWAQLTTATARRDGASFDPLDPRLLGAVVGAAERVRLLREVGLGVGWWTLAAGAALEDGARPTLDGEPLRSINLVGFDPTRPHWLSDEDREGLVRVSESPALAGLLARHALELTAAGWQAPPARWRYAELPAVAVDDDLRDLYALASRERLDLGDPFTDAGCAAFLDWVDSESPFGAGVSWYLSRLHERRADLAAAFPDLAGGDGRRLVEWMAEHGVREEPVLAALAERRASTAASARSAPAMGGDVPVRVVGYLEDGLGLGQAARSYAGALRAAGLEVETVSVPAPLSRAAGPGRLARRRQVGWESDGGGGRAPRIEIVCMNPPELLRAHRAGMRRADGCHRIGVWAWELDAVPPDWAEAFALVDEIWVYSEYVASALRRQAPVPVHVMPLAVEPRVAPPEPLREPDASFTFLFVFDLLSSIERKNPLGLIEAFRVAFEPGEGPRLLLKTSNGDNMPQELERVRVAALGRPDVEVLDAFLAAEELDALIATCDCYVSLHRAEGFGLTLAEAMVAGRPVMATGFSGNLDFMTEADSYLVDWRPVRVEEGSAIYTAGAIWAEPDLEHASALMRHVHESAVERRARGERARDAIVRQLAPEVVGATLRRRVEQVLAGGAADRRGGAFKRALGRRRRG
jgi:glycosyltransferase involved in cell wall biosynthesis